MCIICIHVALTPPLTWPLALKYCRQIQLQRVRLFLIGSLPEGRYVRWGSCDLVVCEDHLWEKTEQIKNLTLARNRTQELCLSGRCYFQLSYSVSRQFPNFIPFESHILQSFRIIPSPCDLIIYRNAVFC